MDFFSGDGWSLDVISRQSDSLDSVGGVGGVGWGWGFVFNEEI